MKNIFDEIDFLIKSGEKIQDIATKVWQRKLNGELIPFNSIEEFTNTVRERAIEIKRKEIDDLSAEQKVEVFTRLLPLYLMDAPLIKKIIENMTSIYHNPASSPNEKEMAVNTIIDSLYSGKSKTQKINEFLETQTIEKNFDKSESQWTYKSVESYRCGGDQLVRPVIIKHSECLTSIAVLSAGTIKGQTETIAKQIVSTLNAMQNQIAKSRGCQCLHSAECHPNGDACLDCDCSGYRAVRKN